MKNLNLLILAAIFAATTATDALAASKKPAKCLSVTSAVDGDGDGYCATRANTPAAVAWHPNFGDYDCNDGKKEIHPGATEVVGDKIDQDCNGRDVTMPVSDEIFGKYVKSEYGGKAPSRLLFVKEYGRCRASGPNCRVDDKNGKFVATYGYVFVDIYDGSSKTLHRDGVREVVTPTEVSHFPKPSGVSDTRSREIWDEKFRPIAIDWGNALSARDKRIDEVEQLITDPSVGLAIRTRWLEKTLWLPRLGVVDRMKALEEDVESIGGRGLMFDIGGGPAFVFRSEMPYTDKNGEQTGEYARKGFVPGAGLKFRLGYDGDHVEFAGFALLGLGNDGVNSGTPDRSILVGADAGVQVDNVFAVGGWAGYLHQEDRVSSVESSVMDDGIVIGGSLNFDLLPNKPERLVLGVMGGAGRSWYGTRGRELEAVIVDGDDNVGVLTFTVGGGFGAPRQQVRRYAEPEPQAEQPLAPAEEEPQGDDEETQASE